MSRSSRAAQAAAAALSGVSKRQDSCTERDPSALVPSMSPAKAYVPRRRRRSSIMAETAARGMMCLLAPIALPPRPPAAADRRPVETGRRRSEERWALQRAHPHVPSMASQIAIQSVGRLPWAQVPTVRHAGTALVLGLDQGTRRRAPVAPGAAGKGAPSQGSPDRRHRRLTRSTGPRASGRGREGNIGGAPLPTVIQPGRVLRANKSQ